jgi:cytochrome c2
MLRLTALLLTAVVLAACQRPGVDARSAVPGADPHRGKQLIAQIGCGKCHMVPGVTGADGLVGPPLQAFGRRTVIAGFFPNTPDNLVHWIQAPQRFLPGNAMPNMEINDHDARDVAAYLYSLR